MDALRSEAGSSAAAPSVGAPSEGPVTSAGGLFSNNSALSGLAGLAGGPAPGAGLDSLFGGGGGPLAGLKGNAAALLAGEEEEEEALPEPVEMDDEIRKLDFRCDVMQVLRILIEVLSPSSLGKIRAQVPSSETDPDLVSLLEYAEMEIVYFEFCRFLLRLVECKTEEVSKLDHTPVHEQLDAFLRLIFFPSFSTPYSGPEVEAPAQEEKGEEEPAEAEEEEDDEKGDDDEEAEEPEQVAPPDTYSLWLGAFEPTVAAFDGDPRIFIPNPVEAPAEEEESRPASVAPGNESAASATG